MEYFKHDIMASEDDKICELLSGGGYEMLGYYWRFVEYLYSRGGKLAKNKLNSVAWHLHFEQCKLEKLVYDFGLFEDDGEYIYSKRVLSEVEEFEAVGKRMVEIGKAGGKASAQARAKRTVEKNQPTVNRMVNRTVENIQADGQPYGCENPSGCLTEGQADAQQKKIKENKRKENKIKEEVKEEKTTAITTTTTEADLVSLYGYSVVEDYKKRFTDFCNRTGANHLDCITTITKWIREDGVKPNPKDAMSSFNLSDVDEMILAQYGI